MARTAQLVPGGGNPLVAAKRESAFDPVLTVFVIVRQNV